MSAVDGTHGFVAPLFDGLKSCKQVVLVRSINLIDRISPPIDFHIVDVYFREKLECNLNEWNKNPFPNWCSPSRVRRDGCESSSPNPGAVSPVQMIWMPSPCFSTSPGRRFRFPFRLDDGGDNVWPTDVGTKEKPTSPKN